MNTRTLISCLCALALAAPVAVAQNIALDWFTVDGGGGTSASAVYTVTGTIGQPDAAPMQGGAFSLQGGFWGLIGSPDATSPTLHITREAGQLAVSWNPLMPGFALEENTNLSPSGWTPVSGGGTSPVRLSVTGATRFFRLRN